MKTLLVVILGSLCFFSTVTDGLCLMKAIRIQEMAQRPDVIIIGQVQDVKVQEGGTYVQISVIEYLKNLSDDKRETITIRTQHTGVAPDGKYWSISDEPEFEIGDLAILFLEKDDGKGYIYNSTPADYKVVGRFQGKYKIIDNNVEYNEATSKKAASIPLDKFKLELKKVIDDPFGHKPNFISEEEKQ